MSLLGESLGAATEHAIWKTLERRMEGAGGLIAMDADGRVEFTYSTRGMYRGWISDTHPPMVAIFED
jgi:beta-aspartyl-peptidase (threonine type)